MFRLCNSFASIATDIGQVTEEIGAGRRSRKDRERGPWSRLDDRSEIYKWSQPKPSFLEKKKMIRKRRPKTKCENVILNARPRKCFDWACIDKWFPISGARSICTNTFYEWFFFLKLLRNLSLVFFGYRLKVGINQTCVCVCVCV